MKVIVLVPIKNEAWILPTFLSSLEHIADQIIAIDDFSTDNSKAILERAGAVVVNNSFPTKKGWSQFKIRQKLLDLGRKHGGTHFICIDADEALTRPFASKGLEFMKNMKPGECCKIPWLALWKTTQEYRDDGSIWSNLYKQVIFCDDGITNFINTEEASYNQESGQRPHTVGPTPCINTDKIKTMSIEDGALLHYQFSNWDHFQWKQVHKRCLEMIQRPKDYRRINNTYSITLDSPAHCNKLKSYWIKDIKQPDSSNITSWQKEEVYKWIDEYGYEFFEPLQIWHIDELRENFVKKIKREPKSKVFPQWLVAINKLRRKFT